MTAETRIASHGVPYCECLRVSAAGRYPSSAMAKGMRVVVSTVLLSSATLPTIAARVIQVPSHGPPKNDRLHNEPPIAAAASEKYPVCHFSQLPAEASPASVGRKYAAIESGTTTASARG